MKTIWKYSLPLQQAFEVDMPANAKLLAVQPQNGNICLWAMVDPAGKMEARQFKIVGTGHAVPGNVGPYVGTVQLNGFVWHLFEGSQS